MPDPTPVALVTGAARGIGRAAALLLGEEHRVVVVDVDVDGGQATVERFVSAGGAAYFVRADLSEPSGADLAVGAALAQFGRLDVLVNNAAVTRVIDFFDLTPADWDQIMAVNARGYFFTMQAAARAMKGQGSGSVVNVSSIAGKGWRHTTNIAYAASKAAVVGMTRIAAAALGPYAIRVNAVCPGMTRTEMMQSWVSGRSAEQGIPESDLLAGMTEQVALRRLIEPAEVAAAIAYLCSPQAAGITGQSLNVDGGVIWD